jgi:hypothetical protein
MYTILQDYVIISFHFMPLNMIILEPLACGWCWCELVHTVPMLTCHSLMLIGLLRCLHFLPTAAVWLCCPSLDAWLGIF